MTLVFRDRSPRSHSATAPGVHPSFEATSFCVSLSACRISSNFGRGVTVFMAQW